MHLPCARSHSNASMLAALLVDQCFTVFGGEQREEKEKRGEREEGKKEERRKKERDSKKEKEEN